MTTNSRGRPYLLVLAAIVLGIVFLLAAALLTTREAAAPTPDPQSTAPVVSTSTASIISTAVATGTAQAVADPDARYAVTTAVLDALGVLYMTSGIEGRLEISTPAGKAVLAPGQLMLLSGGEVHGVVALADSSALVTVALRK